MFRLALKNFFGAGLRTWLNILVLSIAFVAIIWLQGIFLSFERRALEAVIAEETGGGHLWHQNYDPYDPLTFEDSFASVPQPIQALETEGNAASMLIYSAVAYPFGRMHNATLRGIDPEQQVLKLPTEALKQETEAIPVMLGARMARTTRLSEQDRFMVRWRTPRGALDAREMQVVKIISMESQGADSGQIWMPLDDLRSMLQIGEEATKVVFDTNYDFGDLADIVGADWTIKTQYDLTEDIRTLTAMADIEYYVFYIVLLFLALISIFDTQILALFRRRKEMGTLMALGMTRKQLIGLFTLEGILYALLAVVIGAVYGTPILILTAKHGFPLPEGMDMDSFGIPGISDTIYPDYNLGNISLTILISIIIVIIVSYLPARKISKLKPTDALRGKWS